MAARLVERGERADRRIAGGGGGVGQRGDVFGAVVVVLDRAVARAQQLERADRVALVVLGNPQEQPRARRESGIGLDLDDLVERLDGLAQVARLDVGDSGVQLRPGHDRVFGELLDDALELACVFSVAQELRPGVLEPVARRGIPRGGDVGDERPTRLPTWTCGEDGDPGQEHDA